MRTRRRGTVLLGAELLLAVLAAAGCREDEEKFLKPMALGTGEWERAVFLPVLDARFNLRAEKRVFRDDGLYQGNLTLHTAELEREFAPAAVTVHGKVKEGLVAEVETRDGSRGLVTYVRSVGDPILDKGRRELLRAEAVLRLGMRQGLEDYFRAAGVRLQLRGVTDRQLAKLVEAQALRRLGCPIEKIEDPETRTAAQMLLDRGYSPPGEAPEGPEGGG
jgi:hypothetical protein